MGKRLSIVLAIAVLLSSVTIAQESSETVWKLDAVHSNVGFSVTHLVISETEGEFGDFSANIDFNPDDVTKSKAEVTIKVASIDTDNDNRDSHLKSADFFDAENFPTITFVSKSVKKTGDNSIEVTGDLTIKETTKEVILTGEHSQIITDPWGNKRIGFKLHGEINRQDFGISWNKAIETGGLVVSNEVELEIDAELVQSNKG